MLLTNLNTHTSFVHEINNERIKSNVTSVKVALREDESESEVIRYDIFKKKKT